MGGTAREDSPMSKSKRGTSVVEDIQNSPKRRKTQGGLYNNDVQTAELAQCNANSVGAEETGLRRGFLVGSNHASLKACSIGLLLT
jgi:hypothetical protein